MADTSVPGLIGSDAVEYYGGHLIAESIAPNNIGLIAAAPDLLKALKALRATLHAAGYATDHADKAIAKAEGRS